MPKKKKTKRYSKRQEIRTRNIVKELIKENRELKSALANACTLNNIMQSPENISAVEFFTGDGGGKVASIILPEIGLIDNPNSPYPILGVRPRQGCSIVLPKLDNLTYTREGKPYSGPDGFEIIKRVKVSGKLTKFQGEPVPPMQVAGEAEALSPEDIKDMPEKLLKLNNNPPPLGDTPLKENEGSKILEDNFLAALASQETENETNSCTDLIHRERGY
jgi:hypothetical protein